MALLQIRPYIAEESRVIEWLAFGSNAFNAAVPFYANVTTTPEYLANTTDEVTTDNFYWANRLVAAMADADFGHCLPHIERYQEAVMAKGHELIHRFDGNLFMENDAEEKARIRETANQAIADELKKLTQELLGNVLYTRSCGMRNSYSRSDN